MEQSIWAVVPAAGVGRRMGGDVPKQYLQLGSRSVLEHTVERLRTHRAVRGVVVAVAADDAWFASLAFAEGVERVNGGAQRADSVLSALEYLLDAGHDGDWAMVHDAVRPCVHPHDLDRLIDHCRASGRGAILACPVRDTMKRVGDDQVITATVPRTNLWHALTPQLFPLRALRDALLDAREHGVDVTDEAQAMERIGRAPGVVHGRADNIKITRPEDLALAALYLQQVEHS